MSEPVILTDEQLRACCEEWQKRLRLQDWTVTIRRVRASKFEGGTSKGAQVSWSLLKRTANIMIAEPEDYEATSNPPIDSPQDMEVLVVHELLHLHYAPLCHVIKAESIEERHEEQAVHSLSCALVALKRGKV